MSTSENLELQLQLHFAVCILHFAFCICISHFAFCISHFAFCILHFTKFAGGKNRLLQTHSQSRCAIVLCRVANRTPRAFTALNIHATRDDKTQGNCLWPLYSISYWTWILAKRRTMLATFCKVFGSGHLQDAKLSSLVLAHCWLSNLFCKLTNNFKALMDSTPKFASCSSCTDAAFCILGQHWQEIWEIAKFLTFPQTIF